MVTVFFFFGIADTAAGGRLRVADGKESYELSRFSLYLRTQRRVLFPRIYSNELSMEFVEQHGEFMLNQKLNH